MYELSLRRSMIEVVQQQTEQHDVECITGAWLEIGALSYVEESAVHFSFDIVCQGTLAQGRELHIDYKPIRAWYRGCSQVVEITQHDAQCPLCQDDRLWVDTDDPLEARGIEVE